MTVTCNLPETVFDLPEILVEVKVDEKARVWIDGVEVKGKTFQRFVPLKHGKNRIEIDCKTKGDFKKIEHWILNLKREEHEFELQDGYIFLMEILDAFKIKTEWIISEKTINIFVGEEVFSITVDKDTLMHNNVPEQIEPVVIVQNKMMITPRAAGIFGSVSVMGNKANIVRFS